MECINTKAGGIELNYHARMHLEWLIAFVTHALGVDLEVWMKTQLNRFEHNVSISFAFVIARHHLIFLIRSEQSTKMSTNGLATCFKMQGIPMVALYVLALYCKVTATIFHRFLKELKQKEHYNVTEVDACRFS